jgi:methionine-rich copper-binding protein CopC
MACHHGRAEVNGERQPARWRFAATLMAAVVGALAPATPAFAHSQLQRTAPTNGAVVTSPIDTVTLTFNEMVRGAFTTVVVNGPDGVSYSNGHVRVVDDNVFQAVYPLRSGTYTVAWRAISADGHPVEGQFEFRVALPPGEEPTGGPPRTPSTPAGGSTGSWLIWAGLGVALVLAAVAFWILARRPAPATPTSPPDRAEPAVRS